MVVDTWKSVGKHLSFVACLKADGFMMSFFERKPHVLSNCLMALDPNHGQMLTFHADIAPLSRPRSLWRSDWVRLHLSRGFTGYHETTVVVSDEFLTLTVCY